MTRSSRFLPAVLLLALTACEKPEPVVPVAGIYAVQGQASVSWGPKKKPTVRRGQPGMLLLSNMLLDSDKGVVLEAFDGSFVWLPKGERAAARLKLSKGASQGLLRPIVVVTDVATRKDVPPPLVASRYEQPPAKPVEVGENAELKSDFSFFFSPKSDEPVVEEAPKGPPEPPWARKEKFIHQLHRPVKAGDGARTLTEARGAVVVEFLDMATAFAETLKLPVDLSDVRRVVVVDGSAALALPGGKRVELKAGDVAEIQPLP